MMNVRQRGLICLQLAEYAESGKRKRNSAQMRHHRDRCRTMGGGVTASSSRLQRLTMNYLKGKYWRDWRKSSAIIDKKWLQMRADWSELKVIIFQTGEIRKSTSDVGTVVKRHTRKIRAPIIIEPISNLTPKIHRRVSS